MGKNKRKHPGLDEILERPWCYYCERDFDDLKILINHQKAKHYKCDKCGRRLNTAGGLSVHMTQVHKESLASIENALPNRAGLDIEIFGMEGIPEEVHQSHRQRVITQYAQAEADRRASTGNPATGEGADGAAKKPKMEGVSDIKKRLAEHKAKKAAEEAAGVNIGNNSMMGDMADRGQSPGGFPTAGSPSYPSQQQPNFGAPNNPPFQAPQHPYGQQQPPQFPPQSSPPPPYNLPQSPFSPPGMHQYPNNQGFPPPQQFQPPPGQGPPQFMNGPPQFHNGFPPQFQNGPPPQFQNGLPHFQGGPPQFHNSPQFSQGPPQHFGPGSPVPFQQNQFQPPKQNTTPPQHNGMPQRPGNLPPAPGLPQRPMGGPPPVNFQQMQQMHQGQLPTPPNTLPNHQGGLPKSPLSVAPRGVPPPGDGTPTVSGATPEVEKPKAEQPKEEKKPKKEKDRAMKLVYSDNEVSPEEKMAKLPRYAFAPAA